MALDDPVLVTWFHGDAPGRGGSYAQALGDAASPKHYEIYLRCVDVCMASFRRWNPDARALVVLNERAERSLDRGRRSFWEAIGVETVVAPNTHQPQTELYSRWQNQTFLFDVIAAACRRTVGEAPMVVVDSDVVVLRPLTYLAAAIRRDGLLSMQVPFAEAQEVHGLTRADLGRFHTEWSGRSLDFAPAYQGGEFVAGTADELRRMLTDVEAVYEWSIDRQTAGQPHPHEEAQMISIARPVAQEPQEGEEWIARIWTQPWTHRAIPSDPDALPMWHLPAEKKTGLKRLARACRVTDSWFWEAPPEQWRRRVGLAVGVPDYGVGKAVRDGAALANRLPGALRRRIRSADRPGAGVA